MMQCWAMGMVWSNGYGVRAMGMVLGHECGVGPYIGCGAMGMVSGH